MTSATKPKRKPAKTFEDNYRSALFEFAEHGGEPALRQAYDLGRRAIEDGKSLIELTSLYHEALLALLDEAESADQRASLSAAAVFLAESLSPYEMAHRGFQDSLKALRQLNETLEEEIKRIAYAVHDEAGQLLVAVHLALADVSRDLPKLQQDQLARVEQLLNQVETQLRRYSHELRPTVLDDLGWIPAIRFLAEGVTKRANLPIRIKAAISGRLPTAVEIALYRTVQEALTNATKHARAKRVSIQIRRTGAHVCCSIEDDGSGFDVRAIQSDPRKKGLGLLGMQERMNAIGGTLSIDSAPGRGTKLSIRVPVRQE
jgi:signal transduction histidine kinase